MNSSFSVTGSAGGLMSLCLGFSGMSIVELLYFLTLRAWWYYQRKQNQSGKKSEDTSKVTTTDTSRDEASVMELDVEADDDGGPIFTRRNLDVTELPRVSIEDECSTFVELE